MSDKIIVLYNGKIVDYQDADLLFEKPKDNYTKKLIKAHTSCGKNLDSK